MHPFQPAFLGQIGEVPPDRLKRDAEMLGQSFDGDLSILPRDFKDISVAKGMGHGQSRSGLLGLSLRRVRKDTCGRRRFSDHNGHLP